MSIYNDFTEDVSKLVFLFTKTIPFLTKFFHLFCEITSSFVCPKPTFFYRNLYNVMRVIIISLIAQVIIEMRAL